MNVTSESVAHRTAEQSEEIGAPANGEASNRVRLAIQQPALPAYRVPLFRELAQRGKVQLSVHYGSQEPALLNAEPDGFRGEMRRALVVRVPRLGELMWQPDQWRLAGSTDIDVLVLEWNSRFLSMLPASKRPARWRDWLRALPARMADSVVVYSPSPLAALTRAGVSAKKIVVAPNGLDFSAIQRARRSAIDNSQASEALRQHHGLVAGATLLHIGRLKPANLPELIVQAAAQASSQLPDLRVIFIGEGDAEKSRLEALAKSLGIGDRLVFAGAIYDEARLAVWMQLADVLIYPQNAGLSIIHGFNYGLPAIICRPMNNHGPEAAMVVDGETGLVVSKPAVPELVQAVETLLGSPALRAHCSARALLVAEQQCNTTRMAEAFESLIQLTGRA